MSFRTRQKSISSELDEPKYSALIRFNQTSQSRANKQQKSVKKSSSIKYLKEISPKRQKSSSKNIGNKILQLLENYEQKLQNQEEQNLEHFQSNHSQIPRTLKTIDTNQKRNCQTSRSNHEKSHYEQKFSIKQNMLQKFQSNQAKIILMRQNLEKIFGNFRQRQKQIADMKSSLKNSDKIKSQNSFLSKQISRVQKMIKQALLERQKIKYGPFSQLTKRNKK